MISEENLNLLRMNYDKMHLVAEDLFQFFAVEKPDFAYLQSQFSKYRIRSILLIEMFDDFEKVLHALEQNEDPFGEMLPK